jgi:hypothetical protein
MFLTLALVGGEWQLHASAALPQAKELPVPFEYEAGWATGSVWTTWGREISWPYRVSNSVPFVIKCIVSRYTDISIPDLKDMKTERATLIQCTSPHSISLSSTLILPSHLHLGLPSSHFPSGFSIKTCIYSYRFIIVPKKVKVSL